MPADFSLLHCQIIVLDAKGKKGRVQFYAVAENANMSGGGFDIEGFMQFTAQKLDPLIDGEIIDLSARVIVPLPSGLKSSPLSTSDREEGALFHFRTKNNASVLMRLPTFNEDIIAIHDTSEDFFQFIVIFTNPEVHNLNVFPASSHGKTDGNTDEDIALLEALTESFKAK